MGYQEDVEKLGEGDGLLAWRRAASWMQVMGTTKEPRGRSWMLLGRGTCPKQGQTPLLCPLPAGWLLGGRGRPIPAAYCAMQTLGCTPWAVSPFLLTHQHHWQGALWRRREKNKLPTSERLQLCCLPASCPVLAQEQCQQQQPGREQDPATSTAGSCSHLSMLELAQGRCVPVTPCGEQEGWGPCIYQDAEPGACLYMPHEGTTGAGGRFPAQGKQRGSRL